MHWFQMYSGKNYFFLFHGSSEPEACEVDYQIEKMGIDNLTMLERVLMQILDVMETKSAVAVVIPATLLAQFSEREEVLTRLQLFRKKSCTNIFVVTFSVRADDNDLFFYNRIYAYPNEEKEPNRYIYHNKMLFPEIAKALSWRFDRVGSDSIGTFFKLVNAESGRLLTPSGYNVSVGTDVIMYGSESAQCQHWYVIPVETDHLGNDLYYKIVNYSDTSLALTQEASGVTLASYIGADDQLWLLNADGLQGFAGYCFDDNTDNVKAADIGGLFGKVVEATTFEELKAYATSETPYTIVVTADIQVTSLTTDSTGRYYCPDGRIYVRNNKTIIGSYSANTLYNVQFCTSTSKGSSDNVIIKNFELQHDAESNGNDSIVVYFGGGENLWVDHCTFVGHSDYNTASTGLEDWDKFLACCYDADYCTVSDCSFGLYMNTV